MQIKPKITVITVVYNAESFIERTMKSVLEQTLPSVEYILVDGGSSDRTLAIIEKYRSQVALLISEKDNGIYDAMNKGLRKATGDYVLFLNAGDLLAEPTILSKVFATEAAADVYYGNTKIIDKDGTILGDRRLKPPSLLNWRSLRFGMCVSHQSFIAKRELCEEYDLTYKISADIDWVIRILKKSKRMLYINETISRFLEGGISAKGRSKALTERFKIMVLHYGFIPTVFNHLYILIRYPIHKIFRKSMS